MKTDRFVLLVIILGCLIALGPLSIDMYLPAFPDIAKGFGVSVAQVELSLASYFAGIALGQLLYGAMTDRWGRKPPVYLGLTVFGLASLACAMATDLNTLIVLRFVQALGGSAGMVVSRAMVRDLFEPREAARVFSMLMLVMGLAPMLAPLMGGYVNLQWGWPAIFLIVAGLSALSFVSIIRFLPETKAPDPSVHLKRTFLRYLDVFKDRNFVRYALTGGISQAGMFAYISGSPKVFMEHFGISAFHYSWLFGLNAMGLIFMAQVNAYLLKKHHPEGVLRIIIFAVFLLAMILFGAGLMNWGFWGLSITLFLYLSLLGMTNPNTVALALTYQGHQAGTASALLGTMQFVFAAFAAGAVSLWNSGSVASMTTVIAICGSLAMLSYVGLGWKESPEEGLPGELV